MTKKEANRLYYARHRDWLCLVARRRYDRIRGERQKQMSAYYWKNREDRLQYSRNYYLLVEGPRRRRQG